MFVCCECCVLSGRAVCDELITHPEESYRLWYVVVCDLETSRMRKPWPALGRSATAPPPPKKKVQIYSSEFLKGPHISSRHDDRWHPMRGCYWQTPRRKCMTYERWINVHKWLPHYPFIVHVRYLFRLAEKTWWLSLGNLVTSVLIYPSLQVFEYLDVHGSVHHSRNAIERTNKMQPCSRIYYSIVS